MKSTTENVVECVNAILKTLECSICLELLNNPVSTGCGHFFCRFCITETLQSNYRSPCPLCKKSFTRRGIQDAHQRKSILAAARELADVCEAFADVKFFNKDSQRKAEDAKGMPILTTYENQSNAAENTTRTSTGRKRKSNEKEKAFGEVKDSLPILEKIETNKIDVKFLNKAQTDSSNSDEIISTSNKRCRQSVEDSDSDDLPELETIFHSDENSSIKNVNVSTTTFATKTLKNTIKASNNEPDINSTSKNISTSTKTNMKISTSIPPKNNKSDNQITDEFSKQQIKPHKSKGLKIVRKRRFNTRNLKEKNKTNPLRNKTNELNIDDTATNNVNIAMNVIEEADKNLKSVFNEKLEELGCNKDVIKENKHTKDVDLFSSPVKKNCNKSSFKIVGLKKKTKPEDKQQELSSEEQENLNKKLNEDENFELTIENSGLSVSKNTIPSTVLVNNSKECYNLSETNIPEVNEAEKSRNIKKVIQSDEITDTAISVQSVASPETSKTDLGTKSPGWSKVKQVGKDFRMKKFSKLSVAKNSTHNCSTEITSASSSESSETPKFKKLCSFKIAKDVHNEDLSKNSESTKITKASSLEIEVAGDKQSVEHLPNSYKRIEITTVPSESDQFNNNLEKDIGRVGCETDVNLHFSNEKFIALNDGKEIENNSATLLPNDCSLLEKDNLTSNMPAIVQLSSLSNDKSEIEEGTHKSDFNAGIGYEKENMYKNHEENMEVDHFSANNELLKQPEYGNVFDKEIPVETLSDANLYTEVYHPNEIKINKKIRDQCNIRKNEPCYVESVLSSEKSFLGPDLNILHNANKIKENKIFSKISKITATKSIFDKDESVYYTEHSQQTSQRFLEFCNDGQRKQNTLTGPVAPLNIPFYSAPDTQGVVAKRSFRYNEVKKHNPVKFMLGPQNAGKTKVLKRTCLTLDEIQEAFANSSQSGMVETICSLPFSSGDFRLHVCVSEETLNISVLKVVESEFDQQNILKAWEAVNEPNIQTSYNDACPNSPGEILPSSNVASDSSQPDQSLLDGNSKVKNNIFPYLNKYFPDSESVDVKESLNESEVIPFQGSNHSLNKNEVSHPIMHLEEETGNYLCQNDNSLPRDNVPSSLLVLNKDGNNIEINRSNSEMHVSLVGKTDSKLNDSSESLPPTLPYLENKQSSVEDKIKIAENHIADITEQTEKISENNLSSSEKVVELTDTKANQQFVVPNSSNTGSLFSNQTESKKSVSDDDDENINFDELISDQKTSISSLNDIAINDSDGLSSDPAMAFASRLVAPLKNIATKMNNGGTKTKAKTQTIAKTSEVFNSREKRSLQEFEELVFNLNKNSSNDSSVYKPSRLSLKSKRTTKKFKRIKKFESDDDSDENSDEPSKEKLSTEGQELTKDKMEVVQVPSSKTKGNEGICESMQEQSTLNSFCSEDITSKDPNELVMEVEDLNKKIYSVVEQLKQCGREDVLKQVLDKLHEKESPISDKSDKDLCLSEDSEDSTDIFSQTVPPTPPDNTNSANDSVFKSLHYKQN